MNEENSSLDIARAQARRVGRRILALIWVAGLVSVAWLLWPVVQQARVHQVAVERENLIDAACNYAGHQAPNEPDLLTYLTRIHNSPPYRVVMHGHNDAQVSFDASAPVSANITVTVIRGANGEWVGVDEVKTKHPL